MFICIYVFLSPIGAQLLAYSGLVLFFELFLFYSHLFLESLVVWACIPIYCCDFLPGHTDIFSAA